MNTSNKPAARRRGRDPKKEAVWRERLSHQTRSGLTVHAFCEREALKETAFYFWRREIRRRDCQSMGGQTPALAFVEVHAAPMPAAVAAEERACPEPVCPELARSEPVEPVERALREAPLELVFPDDRRLLIRAGCDAGLLARVVAVLASVSVSNRPALAALSLPAVSLSNQSKRSLPDGEGRPC